MKRKRSQSSQSQHESVRVDHSQSTVLNWITRHRIDLTKKPNQRDIMPRQYVWISLPGVPTYEGKKGEEQRKDKVQEGGEDYYEDWGDDEGDEGEEQDVYEEDVRGVDVRGEDDDDEDYEYVGDDEEDEDDNVYEDIDEDEVNYVVNYEDNNENDEEDEDYNEDEDENGNEDDGEDENSDDNEAQQRGKKPDHNSTKPSGPVQVYDLPRPENAAQPADITQVHRRLVSTYLRVFLLSTPNTPYLRWEFCLPQHDHSVLIQLWTLLRLDKGLLEEFADQSFEKTWQVRQPVFVERYNGLYFGKWAHELSTAPRKATALFVQMFGVLNLNPCRCCDENYRRATTTLRFYKNGQGENKSLHVTWPFFGCVSYESADNGRCGNCWWLGRRCSWTDVNEGHPQWDAKAKGDRDEPKVADKLQGGEMSRLVPMMFDGAFERM
ncbi:uncharacterized protein C8A04DRAFT_27680 [Dichotomopilus funicola]|uniref:Uncharacterized protein n=1 Tax=Dichotomopilus funicola TaxID=1934379 RepID=A0AAN6V6M0_9PEZI|nr:hypothetical protein C8A04DRAFT_27680 [Dichotomopilus funicola]